MNQTIKRARPDDDFGVFVWEEWFVGTWLLKSVKVFYIWSKSRFIENLFYQILFYSFLLPPLLYWRFLRKTGRDIKVETLVYYCVTIFLFLLIDDNFTIPGKIKWRLFTLLEYSFFAVLVYQQLKLRRQKQLVIVLSILFVIFQVLYYALIHKKKFDSIPVGIETILIFIFIFFFLYEQLKDVKDLPIYSNYFFWVSIGLFIYLGGSFFIYLMANSMSREEIIKYWFFTYVVEVIKNFLFIVAVLVYYKNPKKASPRPSLPNLDFIM